MVGQKIAVIDVCDVAVDLHSETVRILELDIPKEKITGWDMFDILPVSDCNRIKALFDKPDFWKNLPPVPGVKEGIRALEAQGYRIHWLTSPWFTCPDWENIRREWLANHFGAHPSHDITFTSAKYLVRGDLLVDDRPKHVKTWKQWNPQGESWLFDMPFNRWFDWPLRCKWGDSGIVRIA